MPYGCAQPSAYSPPDCATDVFHFGRVVSFGILKQLTEGIDLQLPAEWAKFVDTPTPTYTPFENYVNLISPVSGTYDGGEVTLAPGFGTTLEIVNGQTNTLVLSAEYQPKNDLFLEQVLTGKNYGIVFLAGNKDTFYCIQQEDISIIPKAAIADELEVFRRVEFTVKWSKIGTPKSIAVSQAVRNLF